MKMNTGLLVLGLICSFATSSTGFSKELSSSTEALHKDWLDTRVLPERDFYAYANGNWQKNNPIPPEYAAWGSFHLLNEKVQEIIHQLLIKASENTAAQTGSIEQKVGDFYYSGMDEENINRLGFSPLKQELDKIASITTFSDFQTELIHLHRLGVYALFGFGSMQDYQDSQLMIGALMQGGLGLPDRDYYLKKDAKFEQIRKAYVDHIGKMLSLLGETPEKAEKAAKIIMELETKLALVSMSQVDQRDPHAVYHPMNIIQLDQLTPNFSWPAYFEAFKQKKDSPINLAMPNFFEAVNKLLKEIPLDQWIVYLRWNLIHAYGSYLSAPFVNQNFKMVVELSGVEKILPRWKRVVGTENSALGFAIGKIYVQKYFSPASKARVLEMMKNIRIVLQEDIKNLSWMTPATRKQALKKLALMEERVGYPTKWWDYSNLKIDRGPYVLNVMRANEFLIQRDLNKIGKPIDRSEWGMTPQTVNAYYDPSMNNINIPAGILQAPFFDPKAPAAVNYGAIGSVIGHEMTHGFDDQGAQFDAYGNLKNWWTASDLAKFNQATQCISDQFSGYVVNGDMPVQGKLVTGEAVADLGGITLAYKAFHRSKEYKEAKDLEGFTPDQQFFLGMAHVWTMNIRPQQLRNQVTIDPHPPAQFRVNGSLANMPEFQEAFHIPDPSPLVNVKRCVIW